jgi:anti-sigma regulatory factor (Ser/Thr protein kinase)
MTQRARGKQIRRQILRDVKYHPQDIALHISEIFSISRQAVYKHLKKMVDEDWLATSGSTRNKKYTLGPRRENQNIVSLDGEASEHSIYTRDFEWVIEGTPKNIEDIIFYGFTEIVNNSIDHSEGKHCAISIKRTKESINITISDDGEGIFKRITRIKKLSDEKQAILELHKGKLTTDPENHSGQGIFFTSKMFDEFYILSHGLIFNHTHEYEFDVMSDHNINIDDSGTTVIMRIAMNSTRTDKEVFDKFTGGEEDDFAFNKTIIPVNMARINKENLVSRSQAKRLLTRIENFKYVYFDFKDVESIGQAFAHEIFKVYRSRHPDIFIAYQNTTNDVLAMIKRAESELA